MIETTGAKVEDKISSREHLTIVYIHTPLCGTCKVTGKMVEAASVAWSLPVYSLNINQFPSFAEKWKIKSVPSLFVFKKGFNTHRVYAFYSVTYINSLFKQLKGE